MSVDISIATEADAAELAALHNAVARRQTRDHGTGHWSTGATEAGTARAIRNSRVIVARRAAALLGTLTLATKKPWAIDPAYFTRVKTPIYLLNMAVDPEEQRRGVGRRLVAESIEIARKWPADAIRLDAYDHAAGAGPFYTRCGFNEVGRVSYRGTPLIYHEMVISANIADD